jgi:hypothetical protein
MLNTLRRIFRPLQFKPLIPEWDIPLPSKLWMGDSRTASEEQLSLKAIEKKLSVKWTEMIFCDPTIDEDIFTLLAEERKDLPSYSSQDYIKRLDEIVENCVIRWIDDEIGWVLALRRGKTLQPGFLSCYTGVLTAKPLGENSSYSVREYFFSLFKLHNKDIGVDAKDYGNISRLLPFLLDDEHINNFHVDPNIENTMAVANCKFQIALFNGIQTPCVYIPEKLSAPEDKELLLGVNYSLAYLYKMLIEKKGFKFIDRNTFSSLNPALYKQKVIKIKLENLTHTFEIPRLRIMIAKYFPGLRFSTEAFDEKTDEHFKISISDQDVYQALMNSPDQDTITVKPTITRMIKA